MSGIVLQTKATGVVMHPGHYEYFTKREEIKDPYGRITKVKRRMQKHIEAHEAVMFQCQAPSCGKKNCISILKSKGNVGQDILIFECVKCKRIHEVSKPDPEKPTIITTPGLQVPKHTGLYGPDNRPLQR